MYNHNFEFMTREGFVGSWPRVTLHNRRIERNPSYSILSSCNSCFDIFFWFILSCSELTRVQARSELVIPVETKIEPVLPPSAPYSSLTDTKGLISGSYKSATLKYWTLLKVTWNTWRKFSGHLKKSHYSNIPLFLNSDI